jgi:two-component system, OmpR family, response regulator CpxR
MSEQKSNIKNLLVDNEQDFINALSHRIEIRKLCSDVAYNVEQALQLIKDQVPDFIVIEPKMEGIDGIKFLQSIKRNHPNTEIIILTDYITAQDKIEARKLGVFDCFRKSIDADILINSIKSAFKKKSNIL